KRAADAALWEMDGFGRAWGEAPVGLVHLEVRPDLRRQGLARFLLSQAFRYLQDQYFTLLEVQLPQENEAGPPLFHGYGCERVDTGHVYGKSAPVSPPPTSA